MISVLVLAVRCGDTLNSSDDDRLPSQRKKPRDYRTRIDPFPDVWTDVQAQLAKLPDCRLDTDDSLVGISFEGLIIDDLGYVQQSREEMEVLFTLLAERYARYGLPFDGASGSLGS